MVSYNKEQACGDDQHNIVAIVMKEMDMDVQGAMDWIGRLHAELERRFNTAYMMLHRWKGPENLDAQTYAYGLGNWVRANDQWSFESERYFGKRGLEIMRTRRLHLKPRTKLAEIGPVVFDGSGS